MNKVTKGKMKKAISLGLVALLSFCITFTVPTATTVGACETNCNGDCMTLMDLNESGDFAVFANNAEIKCDMEGNVAARNASFNGVHIGLTSNVEGFKTSYIQNFSNVYWCSEILKCDNGTDSLIIGDKYGIVKDTRDNCWWITENGYNIFKAPLSRANEIVNISKSNFKIDFDNVFYYLRKGAPTLPNLTTGTVDINKGNNYNRNGSIVCNSWMNVVNLTMEQYNSMYDFNIVLNEGASVVINLVDYNGQNLDNKVTINGQRQSYKGLAGKVLWNFGDYAGDVSFGETTQGVILAPFAKVIINSTHNGNVIADTVTNPGGEIHKNDFTGMFPAYCCDGTLTDTENDDTCVLEKSTESSVVETVVLPETYEWNFSNSQLSSLGTISSKTTVGNIEINATSAKTVNVANDCATIDGNTFSKSLKLGGAGNTTYRSIKVPVAEGQTIKVYFRSNNTSATRSLVIADVNGNQLTKVSASTATSATYEYTGNDGYVYIYSAGSGVNVYAVETMN